MTPIINCQERRVWLEDQNEARALRMKIGQYVMEEGVLFKKSYMMPMLRCVCPLQANYVIQEIHIGACSMHLKTRSVVEKTIRKGYYWPTMHRDAREEIRKCDSCHIHASIPKLPKTLMTLIMAPCPFFQWGMDVLRPLPKALGKVKFVIVAVNYFKKWIEAKPLSKMTGKEVKKFVWDNIVYSEAVIPAKIGMPTHRIMMIKEGEGNEEDMRLNLNLLQERREAVDFWEARYKMKMEHYYNKRVRMVSFKVGEYVYRKNEASRVENLGKMGPK
uniref:Reverse transcriptase domain-containing protein n=1 Tax=Tanacetum cinerariifolium TaxID=118510 RepID=A0A699HRB7_TANCI|nr:reverse transcriptase domain-containing protein [Tanacetum cinerariifolium]